jgi:hypothetical protein
MDAGRGGKWPGLLGAPGFPAILAWAVLVPARQRLQLVANSRIGLLIYFSPLDVAMSVKALSCDVVFVLAMADCTALMALDFCLTVPSS